MAIPDPIIDFSPLDSEGIREDLPSYRRKWSTLTNVIFREGRLRPRPGFREPWAIRDHHMPATARGVPLAIIEITNPGSNNENRQGVDYALETLIPNGTTVSVAGWTGNHLDIDETVPDSGTTKMITSTTGAKNILDFSALANAPEIIPSVVILCRAQVGRDALRGVLKFYWSSSSTVVHTQEVSAHESNEDPDWDTFAFELTEDPLNHLPFTIADINGLQIAVEFAGGESFLGEHLKPSANGNYTQWTDAVDQGAATFTDYDPVWVWEPESTDTTADNHGIAPAAVNVIPLSKQSWTWLPIQNTFATVTDLEFDVFCLTYSVGSAIYRVFYRTGGTDYTVGDITITSREGRDFASGNLVSTLNPNTGAAWTQAQISGGEFGLQRISGDRLTVLTVHGIVKGTSSSAAIAIDWMSAHVSEAIGAGVKGILGKTQLWSTDKAHFRLTDSFTFDIDDVTNAVALTLPPIVPVDWAILYGQVYMVDGEDATRRYPTAGNLYEALTTNNADGATLLTGRCVASFADRILYGWVKDNASFIPERVSYSKIFNGGTHNDPSAGDLDLLDTPGGVLKLQPLSEDICVAYKQQGIYNLRRTGSDVAPIVRDLVDPFTSLIAPRTVVSTLAPSGTPIQLFLGTNPTHGFNVFAYDGSEVIPVGDGIQKLLRRDSHKEAIRNSFAECDPEAGLYYLFIQESLEQFPSSGFIYHVRTGVWTRFELPWQVSCAGIWTIPRRFVATTNTTDRVTPAMDGTRQVMVATLGGRLLTLDFDAAYDMQWNAALNATQPWIFTWDGSASTGENRVFFTSTIETGDPRPAENPAQEASVYSLHVVHNAHAPLTATTNASDDGGATYGTAATANFGSLGDTDAYIHTKLDVPVTMSHRPRVKLELDSLSPGVLQINPRWEIAEMWIKAQLQGDEI